jgi:hypothetical protein
MKINRKSIGLGGVVALAVCFASLLAFAGSAIAAPQTITFLEVSKGSTFAYVDNAPKSKLEHGFPATVSAGDQFVAASPLVSGGKTIGKERIACTATNSSKSFEGAHFLCSGSFKISGGTLFATTIVGSSEVEGAITGGTGLYANARGTFVVKEGKTSSTVTVTLVE